MTKKYRVNESEIFNLQSMYDRLKCIEIDMRDDAVHAYTDKQWNEIEDRIIEVEELMEKSLLRRRVSRLGDIKENQRD